MNTCDTLARAGTAPVAAAEHSKQNHRSQTAQAGTAKRAHHGSGSCHTNNTKRFDLVFTPCNLQEALAAAWTRGHHIRSDSWDQLVDRPGHPPTP